MKYKEYIKKLKNSSEFRSYFIWGTISSIINVLLFRLLTLIGLEYRIANFITLIIVRIFCYMTNKFFVFKIKTDEFIDLIKEIVTFFCARMITFFMDYFGVILLVELLNIDSLPSKIISAIIVIICNYILSKFFVFKKGSTIKYEINNSNSML